MKQFNLTIPENLLSDDSISPTAKLTYGLLNGGYGVEEIASLLKKSKRTIWRAKAKLESSDKNDTTMEGSDKNVTVKNVTSIPLTDKNVTKATDKNVTTEPDMSDKNDTVGMEGSDKNGSTPSHDSDKNVSPSPEEKKRALNYCLRLIDGLGSEEDYNKNKKKILKMFERHDMFTEEEMAMFDEKLSAKVAKFEEI